MIKRWLVVGATLFVCILLVGCGVVQEEYDVMQDIEQDIEQYTEQAQIESLQSSLTEAQSDLTEAQNDLTEAENQINTLENDLADRQGKYVQVLDEFNGLKSQLYALESQQENQLSDYDALVEKVDKAKIYAEMLEKYILVPYFKLTPQEKIELDHLVHYTGNVELKVYNVMGQLVATLVNAEMKAGVHAINFNAAQFASGVYFYSVKANGFKSVKKMMLVK